MIFLTQSHVKFSDEVIVPSDNLAKFQIPFANEKFDVFSVVLSISFCVASVAKFNFPSVVNLQMVAPQNTQGKNT